MFFLTDFHFACELTTGDFDLPPRLPDAFSGLGGEGDQWLVS
jgi:hypothetical protein